MYITRGKFLNIYIILQGENNKLMKVYINILKILHILPVRYPRLFPPDGGKICQEPQQLAAFDSNPLHALKRL